MSTILAATALLPFQAAASDCTHARNIDLALDVSGIETVAFEVGPHELELRARDGVAATLEGRACASSANGLDDLRVVMDRDGTTLQVRLERKRGSGWSWFGGDEAVLDVTATVPTGLAVRVEVGSGDATVAGVASLRAAVGSGDLQAGEIPGQVTIDVGSGDAELAGIGSLHVASIGSGDVDASRIGGGARIGSIGSGDFELDGAGGDVEVGSVGSGDVEVRNVDGSVRVGSIGSGDIAADGIRGDLVVRATGSGNVRHRHVGGRVDLPADD